MARTKIRKAFRYFSLTAQTHVDLEAGDYEVRVFGSLYPERGGSRLEIRYLYRDGIEYGPFSQEHWTRLIADGVIEP